MADFNFDDCPVIDLSKYEIIKREKIKRAWQKEAGSPLIFEYSKNSRTRISKNCLKKLGDPAYVYCLVNTEDKLFAVARADKAYNKRKDPPRTKVTREQGGNFGVPVSKALIEKMADLMGLKLEMNTKIIFDEGAILGTEKKDELQDIIFFNLLGPVVVRKIRTD